MKLTSEMVRRLADSLHALPKAERTARIGVMAERWGVHPSTVRRRLRSDAGASVTTRGKRGSYIPREDAELIAAMMAKTMRKGRHGLDVAGAIDVAWREGALRSPKKPAVSSMRRVMAEFNISPTRLVTPAPHTRLKSKYGNHVHQIDASLCIQYDFTDKGLKWRYVDTNKLLATKKVKNAIHRWVLVDHLSGYIYPWYVDSPGERTEDLITFLHQAWGFKDDSRIPFCGVPEVVHTDQGAAFRSAPFRNLCKAYDVQLVRHKAGLARATGAAESGQWQHERLFEAKLRLQRIDTVKELIQRATLEAIAYNNTRIHSRHRRTRVDAWAQSVQRPLRVPVEDFNQFCMLAHGKEETRKVEGDLTIQVKGSRYWVNGVQVGEVVKIHPHPFNAGEFKVLSKAGDDLDYTPLTKDEWGFYSHATPYGQKAQFKKTEAEKAHEAARGLEPFRRAFKKESDLPKDIYSFPDIPSAPARAPRRSVALVLSRVEAKTIVVETLGRRLSREEGRWWDRKIGEGCTRDALELLLKSFTASPSAAVA